MNYKKWLGTIAALVMITTIYSCGSSDTNTGQRQLQESATPQGSATGSSGATPEKKSNEQIITEGAVQVTQALIDKGLANKRYKDSLRAAGKQEFWAYTIGVPFDDMEQLAAAFEKTKSIENMAAYEDSDEYTLICTGSSKEQLEDNKGAFKATLAAAGMGNKKVEIMNLAGKCGTRSHIIFQQSRKFKKKHPEIPCYSCN